MGKIKDDAMENNFSGSSSYSATSTVRGQRFREQFSSNGTRTVLPRAVVGRRLQDEERELVDHPLSWKWGEVVGVKLVG